MNGAIETLPAEWYSSTDTYRLEREQIFAREWIYVASEAELQQCGDYITTAIAGYPIYLIRQQDGSIKAFHNVCRHRAAPLLCATAGQVTAKTISCPYHGWSYNLEGKLVAAPHFDCLTDCDRAEWSLFSIQVAIYKNLIFVNLSAEAAPFSQAFRELLEVIENSEFDINSYRFHSKLVREGNFNWKAWVDGFQECYHCMTIHPIFTRDFALQRYKVENHNRFSVHSCERKSESSSGVSNGLWLWAYPNLGLPIYEPCFYTLQVNPLAVNRTQLTYSFHFRDCTDEKLIRNFRGFVDQITDEDINICESVQKNLDTGIYQKGVLHGSRENGVAYFQSLVRQAISSRDGDYRPG